ncbi:aminotransferase class V-fold PLP-dependent enzyme [Planctomycetota bacterium]
MDKMIYLDNAATSFPKPDIMHQTMSDFYRTCGVNPGRTGCDIAIKAEEMISSTRKKLSAFFNGGKTQDPDRLVFTHNATASLNLILRGTVDPGNHVVTTHVEHNSVIRPINHLVKMGVEATFVKPDPEGYIDPEEISRAIKSNTTLVMVNHGSNVTGVVQDIKAIGAQCKAAGVQFAIDSAQTAGVIPIDMRECNISFVAFTGHKGLFGPTGTGGICVADDAHIVGTIWGGTGVRSAHPYHLEEYPYRLEAGTQNLAGIAGISAGQDWLVEEGQENIHSRELELLDMLQTGLKEIKGVTIHGSTSLENRVATCSITVNGFDPSDVGTILDVEHNVIARTGLQCAPLIHEHMGTVPRGTVRLSIGPFNTREDIETAIKAVADVAGMRN